MHDLERRKAALGISARSVALTVLSGDPLGNLIDADAATWLDGELIAPAPMPLRDAGFGQEVKGAQVQRRQWLIEQGLAEKRGGEIIYRSNLIAQLSEELGLRFVEAAPNEGVEGALKRSVELTSGRFALIEKSREFTLVPWRPVLERQIGKNVSGMMRGSSISWSFGRGRKGPEIS